MCEIADSELTLADIPPSNADWGEIEGFALTYNGYTAWGSFGKCAEIANARRHSSLAELRTCLFFEQRAWRHLGDDPDHDAMAYIWSLIEQIRGRVGSGTAVPSKPDAASDIGSVS